MSKMDGNLIQSILWYTIAVIWTFTAIAWWLSGGPDEAGVMTHFGIVLILASVFKLRAEVDKIGEKQFTIDIVWYSAITWKREQMANTKCRETDCVHRLGRNLGCEYPDSDGYGIGPSNCPEYIGYEDYHEQEEQEEFYEQGAGDGEVGRGGAPCPCVGVPTG